MTAAGSYDELPPGRRELSFFIPRVGGEGDRDLRGRSGRFADEGGMEIGGTGRGAIRQSGRHSG